MKLIYIVNARIPTERAHGMQVMKMCEAFGKQGLEVELVIPARWKNSITVDPFEYYQIGHKFRIRRLYNLDLTRYGLSSLFVLHNLIFILSSIIFLMLQKKGSVVYTRGDTVMFWPRFLFNKFSVFVETHHKYNNLRLHLRSLARARGTIVVTKAYQRELAFKYQIPQEKIFWAPDGVDINKFSAQGGSASGGQNSKIKIREELGIPLDKKIIVYTGTDAGWRGVETLKEAVKLFPEDWRMYFVGAVVPIEDERAVFIGHRPPKEIPLWLAAADVLVLCGTAKSEISLNYVSPLKLFEYLAASRPIVATDTPSHREILNEQNAILVKPDDPEAMANGIKKALTDRVLADRIAQNAGADANQYSWDKRAKNIKEFIKAQFF